MVFGKAWEYLRTARRNNLEGYTSFMYDKASLFAWFL